MTIPPPSATHLETPTHPLPRRSPRLTPADEPFHRSTPQPDGLAPERHALILRMGLPTEAHPEYDAFARDMAAETGFLYGFVNPFFADRQQFIGLHQPPAGSGYPIIGRTMSLSDGWCPEVVGRRRALPLHDVYASPRFAGNPVVDAIGIQSYFGAPLIHDSGIVLGTVCVTDLHKRPLADARSLLGIVSEYAQRVMRHMTDGSGR
ncbi:GAF domain-containing protein [Streptomyces griseofuscus]|uniref:GAF domain-containing protein n=1 Tax=Streptomyces griseofuscus TaxID=146922 RepID=UPI0036C74DA0